VLTYGHPPVIHKQLNDLCIVATHASIILRSPPRQCLINRVSHILLEQVWEEYFIADPSQWWDNRVDKVSLGLPVS